MSCFCPSRVASDPPSSTQQTAHHKHPHDKHSSSSSAATGVPSGSQGHSNAFSGYNGSSATAAVGGDTVSSSCSSSSAPYPCHPTGSSLVSIELPPTKFSVSPKPSSRQHLSSPFVGNGAGTSGTRATSESLNNCSSPHPSPSTSPRTAHLQLEPPTARRPEASQTPSALGRCSSPAREINVLQQRLNSPVITSAPDGTGAIGSPLMTGKFRREGFILSYTGPLTDFYDLEPNKLGQGTYGSVCRGINKSTNSVRAIKTIAKSKVKNVERFRQEIAIMKFLDHPNILKLFETFEDHKNIYLVLELCEGGELFDRIIDEGYFSEMSAGALMRQILAAIYYCHQHHIAHRDLKPENFLFLNRSKESPLKIIDFGLAARCDETTKLCTKAGTPYYVAPQVLQGKYTSKCDVWSAGVILYILLCGYPPFHGENDAEILQKVKSGKFTFNESDWKNVSMEAKDLIVHLLVYNPEERYTAEQALNHPWIKHYSTKSNPLADAPLNNQLLESFRAFRALSKLKKAALTVIAQQMNESEISKLKSTFMALDGNGDGTLTVQEIREGLKNSGLREIPADLEHLMQDVDSDGSGVIDYTEFIAASLSMRKSIKKDICWSAFRVFDIDADGKISPEELLQVLGTDNVQGVFSGRDMAEVKAMIKEVDTDGDGQIDFDEFMEMVTLKT